MATTPRFGFALAYVPNVDAVKRFYVDVLGLEVQREAPNFVQFEDAQGAFFAIASDESMTGERGLELYWVVDDAEAAYRELSQKAGVSMPLTRLPFGTVFGLTDPAGQPRYLVQFAQERPSRTV